MITAIHTLIYAEDAESARAFFRDVLGWKHVDAGGGWLIFGTGKSELGVHPTEPGTAHHEMTLMCDDIEQTMKELEAKGAAFNGGITDAGFGRTAMMLVPGAGEMMLYQPRHETAF